MQTVEFGSESLTPQCWTEWPSCCHCCLDQLPWSSLCFGLFEQKSQIRQITKSKVVKMLVGVRELASKCFCLDSRLSGQHFNCLFCFLSLSLLKRFCLASYRTSLTSGCHTLLKVNLGNEPSSNHWCLNWSPVV